MPSCSCMPKETPEQCSVMASCLLRHVSCETPCLRRKGADCEPHRQCIKEGFRFTLL